MSTPLTARILEEHANASRALPPAGPAATRRRTAIAALAASGLPTSRDENWKYANLRPLERLRFAPATPVQPQATDLPAAIPGFARYVFVDGAFAPALSARLDASAATVTPLSASDAGRTAVSGGPDLVRKGLLALAPLAALTLLPSLIRRWQRPGKMSPQQLQTLLSQGESPLVLDVRNPDEFVGERGHIKEAVLVPLARLQK